MNQRFDAGDHADHADQRRQYVESCKSAAGRRPGPMVRLLARLVRPVVREAMADTPPSPEALHRIRQSVFGLSE